MARSGSAYPPFHQPYAQLNSEGQEPGTATDGPTGPDVFVAFSARAGQEFGNRPRREHLNEQLRRGADPAESRAELERRRQDKPCPDLYAKRTVLAAEHERGREGPSR